MFNSLLASRLVELTEMKPVLPVLFRFWGEGGSGEGLEFRLLVNVMIFSKGQSHEDYANGANGGENQSSRRKPPSKPPTSLVINFHTQLVVLDIRYVQFAGPRDL